MQVVDRAELLFSEVLNALRRISENIIVTGPPGSKTGTSKCRRKIFELEGMLQNEKAEFEVFLIIKPLIASMCKGMHKKRETNQE